MKADNLDIIYLGIIQNENEVIEEGKLINSLLAGALGYSASILFPLKIDKDVVNPSLDTEMSQTIATKTVDKGNKLMIDGVEYAPIKLSLEELYVCKFIWAQLKDCKYNNVGEANIEIDMILKTLNTRLQKYKEGDDLYEMLKKIVVFNCNEYDFEPTTKLTYMIANIVKDYFKAGSLTWKDSSVVFYAEKTWKPSNEDLQASKFDAAYKSAHFKFWKVVPKAETSLNLDELSNKEKFLAKVIYSETSSICTPQEVKLICKLIMNRIGRSEFATNVNGKKFIPMNAYDVVQMKGAFSCVNSSTNKNWTSFKPKLNRYTIRDCVYAHYMLKNDQATIKLPDGFGDIVYYHDKSIGTPAAWTNKYFKPELVIETPHFKFYRVVQNKGGNA